MSAHILGSVLGEGVFDDGPSAARGASGAGEGQGTAKWASERGAALRQVRMPQRPSVPAALVAAVALWLIALGVFYAAWALGLFDATVPEALVAGTYEFTLTSDATEGDYGYVGQAEVTGTDGKRYAVQIVYDASDMASSAADGASEDADGADEATSALLFAHERIVAQASFSEFSEETFERYAQSGLVARASLSSIEVSEPQGVLGVIVSVRRWAVSQFNGLEGQGAALLRAVLLGDRGCVEEDGLYDAMKSAGLAHMVAVSGAHLSVVAAFATALLMRLRAPRKLSAALLVAFYATYVVFTGASASVLRASVMAVVAVSAAWCARRASSLAALGVCVCVLIGIDPYNAFSLSFFLSAASTLGIVVLSPLFGAWFDAIFGGRVRLVSDTCALTTAANACIVPVTACVFSRVALVAPVANLIAAPAFTVLLGGGLAALGLCAVAPGIGGVALAGMVVVADAFCELVGVLAGLPLASVPCSMPFALACVLTAGLFVGLWAAWPRARAWLGRALLGVAAVAFAISIALGSRLSGDELIMLDVGQGDALLLRSQGASVLIDTGNEDAMLASALSRAGVVSLDAVLISHSDDDHCASLSTLAPQLASGKVYVTADTLSCDCSSCEELVEVSERVSAGVVALEVGDSVQVGRFTCTVIWPYAFEDDGGNADSMCLLVEYDADGDADPEFTVLLTGDAEADQLESMIEAGLGDVDVMKAGHHGSRAGIDEETASVLSPEVVLISVGENNSYGHPTQEALDAFASVGAQIFRTDEAGDVTCRFSEDGIEVYTQN